MPQLARLTEDLPGIGGAVKQRPEDFRVEELPLAEPSGRGRHVWFRVIKSGVSTPAAAGRIARWMGARAQDVGYAGLKDAQATTSQWMSLEGADARRLAMFRDRQVRVDRFGRCGRKLLAGMLAGNRFSVRIRGVGQAQLPACRAILEVLGRRGVPNYFGQQRFGLRDDNDILGRALVAGMLEEFVAIYLGRPGPGDPPPVRAAREAFDAGALHRAIKLWPPEYAEQRRILSAYLPRRRPRDVLAAIDKRMRRLYISAFQGRVFNEILSRRVQQIDQLQLGDIAFDHADGHYMPVTDPASTAQAVAQFQLSPTALLPGTRVAVADGEPGRVEREVLAANGVDTQAFAAYAGLEITGQRRAMRFRAAGLAASAGRDRHGPFIQIDFTAPPGCYATVLLAEVTGRTTDQ